MGTELVIRVGMIGQVLQDLLEQFKEHKDDATVTGVWMTEEEGIEEKREERDVRTVTQKAGVDLKLWIDEKYFIDE